MGSVIKCLFPFLPVKFLITGFKEKQTILRKLEGLVFFLQPTHYNLYTCWDRYLNVPCACISLFWKHNSFSVDMVPFFSVLIPKHSFDSGSFRSKAHWSLTARLRWTQVCFQSPCCTERHSHGHLWLVCGDLKMETSWLGPSLLHWPSATGAGGKHW